MSAGKGSKKVTRRRVLLAGWRKEALQLLKQMAVLVEEGKGGKREEGRGRRGGISGGKKSQGFLSRAVLSLQVGCIVSSHMN